MGVKNKELVVVLTLAYSLILFCTSVTLLALHDRLQQKQSNNQESIDELLTSQTSYQHQEMIDEIPANQTNNFLSRNQTNNHYQEMIDELRTIQTNNQKKIDELQANLTSYQQTIAQLSEETRAKLIQQNRTIEENVRETEDLYWQIEDYQKHNRIRARDCVELYDHGMTEDGVYTIFPDNSPIDVSCDMSHEGHIVLTKRRDGSLNFSKTFQEYSDGFGNSNEHWLGLKYMHRITKTGKWKLRIDMKSFDNETAHATYKHFRIGPAPEFTLLFKKSSFHGSAKNSLGYHHGMKFTTRDRDQDQEDLNCSTFSHEGAGWWFKDCARLMTTGMPYGQGADIGILWYGWRGNEAIKSVTLKIINGI